MIVEAILLPDSDDFGYFSIFAQLVEKSGKYRRDNSKQKSVVVSANEMWICQHFISNYTGEDLECIHYGDMSTGTYKMAMGNIPDTTVYRVALPELWILFSSFIRKASVSNRDIDRMAKTLSSRSRNELMYQNGDVVKRDGSFAPLQDVVMALSLAIQR